MFNIKLYGYFFTSMKDELHISLGNKHDKYSIITSFVRGRLLLYDASKSVNFGTISIICWTKKHTFMCLIICFVFFSSPTKVFVVYFYYVITLNICV